jgi:phage terminase Nu1 subunit (DNA packaging protein)
MQKRAKKQAALKVEPDSLTGWQQIAAFLGHPAAVVQRWASEGMPVRRQGRFVTTTPEELNAWLGRESGKPVHVATEDTDLAAELKRGLAFVRRDKVPNATKKQTDRLKKAKRRRSAKSSPNTMPYRLRKTKMNV